MDSIHDYYYQPALPAAINYSPSLHSLAPSAHSTLADDSLLYNDDAPPVPPLAAPKPRQQHGSYASLHAAAGLGISHQPTFEGDLEKREGFLGVGHSRQDSSLKERQAYRSTTPVVHGSERFQDNTPSPERRHAYPPTGLSSPTMSHFSSFEKPASIRSVRPSGDAQHLRRLGFSDQQAAKQPMSRRKKQIITVASVLGVIAIIAIVVPIIYVVGKNNEKAAAQASEAAATAATTGKKAGGTIVSGGTGANVSEGIDLSVYRAAGNPLNPLAGPSSMAVQSGASGSTITTYVNGSAVEITYVNDFGGYYFYDPTNPFAKGGKAQSWSPAIEEEWVWGRDIVRGVNLGGWLVPEPFIGKHVYTHDTPDTDPACSPIPIRAIPQSGRRIHPVASPPR